MRLEGEQVKPKICVLCHTHINKSRKTARASLLGFNDKVVNFITRAGRYGIVNIVIHYNACQIVPNDHGIYQYTFEHTR